MHDLDTLNKLNELAAKKHAELVNDKPVDAKPAEPITECGLCGEVGGNHNFESDGSRVLTMECASENHRFALARRIVSLLNGADRGFAAGVKRALKEGGHNQ